MMGDDKQLYSDVGYIKGKVDGLEKHFGFIVKYFEKNGLVEQVRENKTSILWLRLFVLAIMAFIFKLSLK